MFTYPFSQLIRISQLRNRNDIMVRNATITQRKAQCMPVRPVKSFWQIRAHNPHWVGLLLFPNFWPQDVLQLRWVETSDFAPVCHGAAAHLGHKGWDLTNILQMHKCDKIRQVLQPESFVLGCNMQNFVREASHKSKDRPRLPPPAFHVNARFFFLVFFLSRPSIQPPAVIQDRIHHHHQHHHHHHHPHPHHHHHHHHRLHRWRRTVGNAGAEIRFLCISELSNIFPFAILFHHMLWVLQCMYYGQTVRIGDNRTDGDWFCIRGGVRQGCVLSPRSFSCVLEVALGRWRRKVGNPAMDFQDGMHTLLDLRFADDILLFAKTFEETKFLLDQKLVTCLAEVGLHLNVGENKNFDNSITKSKRSASSKWTGNWSLWPWLYTFNGWDACFAQQVMAITPQIWHIIFRLRRKRFLPTDLSWSTGMLLCETISNILTPWSLLSLVSVLRTEKCTNKTCAGWISCLAGHHTFHCWAAWWRGLDVAVAWHPSLLEWTS